MSSIKIAKDTLSGRILELRASYTTDKEFLKKCEINRHNLLSDMRSGKVKAPSTRAIQKIARGTGCNGTWLLTGRGQKYAPSGFGVSEPEPEEYEVEKDINFVLDQADRIARQSTAAKDTAPPPGAALKVARLLVTLLERRVETKNG